MHSLQKGNIIIQSCKMKWLQSKLIKLPGIKVLDILGNNFPFHSWGKGGAVEIVILSSPSVNWAKLRTSDLTHKHTRKQKCSPYVDKNTLIEHFQGAFIQRGDKRSSGRANRWHTLVYHTLMKAPKTSVNSVNKINTEEKIHIPDKRTPRHRKFLQLKGMKVLQGKKHSDSPVGLWA